MPINAIELQDLEQMLGRKALKPKGESKELRDCLNEWRDYLPGVGFFYRVYRLDNKNLTLEKKMDHFPYSFIAWHFWMGLPKVYNLVNELFYDFVKDLF